MSRRSGHRTQLKEKEIPFTEIVENPCDSGNAMGMRLIEIIDKTGLLVRAPRIDGDCPIEDEIQEQIIQQQTVLILGGYDGT